MSTHTHAYVHSHTGPAVTDPVRRRRIQIILALIMVPILIATVAGIVWLWPHGASAMGSQQFAAGDTQDATAKVTGLDPMACAEGLESLEGLVTKDLLRDAVCARITSGPGKGLTMPVHIPAESLGIARVGDELNVLYSPQALGSGTPYIFVDYQRSLPIGLLAGLFVLMVVAVAGLKGMRALIGLVASLAVLLGFMIPALLAGSQPLAVTLVGAMAMMMLAVYCAHGISIRTTTALLGTMIGVVLTTLLALWGVRASHLTGTGNEDAMTLTSLVPHLPMPALLTCGMVIAGLGVLNDVTITQASAVWELHGANPGWGPRRLLRSGMRIGTDHIASTVYTLAFAYAGTALPLILAAALIDRSLASTLVSGDIGEELVRTLVSSIGLVLAIPATTLIAATLCQSAPSRCASYER